MAVINPAWEENSLTRQKRLSTHGGLPLMTQRLPQWRQNIQILTQSQQCHSKRYPGAGLHLRALQSAWIYPAPWGPGERVTLFWEEMKVSIITGLEQEGHGLVPESIDGQSLLFLVYKHESILLCSIWSRGQEFSTTMFLPSIFCSTHRTWDTSQVA